MKQKLAHYEVESTPKKQFLLYLITFHDNVSQSVTVDYGQFLCCHDSRIGFSKSNVYVTEFNIVLLYVFCSDEFKYRFNASNLYRVTLDNGGCRRLSMVVAAERCCVERLNCKGSRTQEYCKSPKTNDMLHENMIFIGNIAITGATFQSFSEQRCSFLATNLGAYENSLRNTCLGIYILRNRDD